MRGTADSGALKLATRSGEIGDLKLRNVRVFESQGSFEMSARSPASSICLYVSHLQPLSGIYVIRGSIASIPFRPQCVSADPAVDERADTPL
jgi:hypothetical protein